VLAWHSKQARTWSAEEAQYTRSIDMFLTQRPDEHTHVLCSAFLYRFIQIVLAARFFASRGMSDPDQRTPACARGIDQAVPYGKSNPLTF
jgi:hypothetical protein